MARHAQARCAVRTPTSTHYFLPFVFGDAGACHDVAERDARYQAADMHTKSTQVVLFHHVDFRYSPNSEDSFPNIAKDVEKSISYVKMGAEQAWNRCRFWSAHSPDVLHYYFPPFLQRRAVHFSTRIQQVPPSSKLLIVACIRLLFLLTSPCALQRVRRAAGQQPVHALLAASGHVRQASVRRLIPPVNIYMLPRLSFCTIL